MKQEQEKQFNKTQQTRLPNQLPKVKLSEMLNPNARGFRALKIKPEK
jgi:hypothetical protein